MKRRVLGVWSDSDAAKSSEHSRHADDEAADPAPVRPIEEGHETRSPSHDASELIKSEEGNRCDEPSPPADTSDDAQAQTRAENDESLRSDTYDGDNDRSNAATPSETKRPVSHKTEQGKSLGTYLHKNPTAEEVPATDDPFVSTVAEGIAKQEGDDSEALSTIEDLGIRVPGLLRSGTALCLSIIIGALLLLFLLHQLLSLLNLISAWPTWAAWLGYSAIAVLVLAIFVSMGYLAVRFARLRETPRISLRLLDELHERRHCRKEAVKQSALAQKIIEEFLLEYPLEEDQHDRLARLGFDPDREIKFLVERRKWLCETAKSGDRMWLDDVSRQFLGTLDEVAARRIRRYSMQVGVKTAIAPTGFLDSAITVINAYLLISDLCEIYHVRTGKWSTFVLLAQVFVNAFAASELEDVTARAGEALADSLRDSIGGMLAGAAGWLSPRIAEGTANGLLLMRLGYATIRHLRPIAAK